MSYVLSGEPRTNSLLMQQNFSALPERGELKKLLNLYLGEIELTVILPLASCYFNLSSVGTSADWYNP